VSGEKNKVVIEVLRKYSVRVK